MGCASFAMVYNVLPGTPELPDDVCRKLAANNATAENLPAMETTFILKQLGRVLFAPTDVILQGFGRFTPRCSTDFGTRSSSWTERMSTVSRPIQSEQGAMDL